MSPQLRLKSAQGGTRQVRLPDLQCGASLAEATTGDPSAPCHIYNIRTKFYVYSDDTHTHSASSCKPHSKHPDLSKHVKLWYLQFSRYQKENLKPQQCKMHVTSFHTTWAQRKSCTRFAEPLTERIAQLCNAEVVLNTTPPLEKWTKK